MKIWKKEDKMSMSIFFSFTKYTLTIERCTQNLKTLAPKGAEKSVTEIYIGEKEKWTNEGTDKQYVAAFLLHNTTHHYHVLFQILES